jgi:hypothetical protein
MPFSEAFLDLLLPADSLDVCCSEEGEPIQTRLLLILQVESRIIDVGWYVLDRNHGEPVHAYYYDPGSSAPSVIYLPENWDGEPFLATESVKYKVRWEGCTDEEWETELRSLSECGELDIVPDNKGKFLLRVGKPEDLETFRLQQDAENGAFQAYYEERKKYPIEQSDVPGFVTEAELAALMGDPSEYKD